MEVRGVCTEASRIATGRLIAGQMPVGGCFLRLRDAQTPASCSSWFRTEVLGASTGLADGSVDFVMLFNILHADERLAMLREAWWVTSSGGRLAVIHWNYDSGTPRGPTMSIRPRPEDCRSWAEQVGYRLQPPGMVDLPPYHYGFVFERSEYLPGC